jgi:hypothetical protein
VRELVFRGAIGALLASSFFYQHSSFAAVPGAKSCHSGSTQHICLGVKAVVYRGSQGEPLFAESEILESIDRVNRIWKQCNIAFQLEQYFPASPDDFHVRFQTKEVSELDEVRRAFSDDHELVIATTGRWDRHGTLGKNSANAWTAMPDGPPYGIVIEAPFGTFAGLLAHEFGHYLGLYHQSGDDGLMNPIIYQRSTGLTVQQCQTARGIAMNSWQKMLR